MSFERIRALREHSLTANVPLDDPTKAQVFELLDAYDTAVELLDRVGRETRHTPLLTDGAISNVRAFLETQ